MSDTELLLKSEPPRRLEVFTGAGRRRSWTAHMEVVDANDQHVGIVEKVEGDRIKLTEKDALDPQHLFLDKSQVASVGDNKVKLTQKVSAVTTRVYLTRTVRIAPRAASQPSQSCTLGICGPSPQSVHSVVHAHVLVS
jgi:hypothetical protein